MLRSSRTPAPSEVGIAGIVLRIERDVAMGSKPRVARPKGNRRVCIILFAAGNSRRATYGGGLLSRPAPSVSDLSQLEIFVLVVDSGSFSAAARALGVSKAHVSKQIRALEDRLGARLLNRTTRKVAPTEIGAGFHARCRRILDDLHEAETTVTELQTTPRGTLRIAA